MLLFSVGCSSGGGIDDYTLTANAGPDQNVTTGSIVMLDGSHSYNSSGDRMTFSWSFDSIPVGSSATLSDHLAVNPIFTADIDGSYELSLVVNGVDADSVIITATAPTSNAVPVANAGTAQNVTTTFTVTLDGSGSSDADFDTLTYSWTLISTPAGSGATIINETDVNPTFVADLTGSYVVQLIVNDGTVDSKPATVIITATSPTVNAAPVANAGPAQNVTTTSTVTLDGSGSSDADFDTLTYSWTLTSTPAGSGATIINETDVNPTFVTDLSGSYVVQLIVNDGTVDSTPATVIITATVSNGTTTGLDFPGSNGVDSYRFRFVDPHLNELPIYGPEGRGVTYIWRCYPRLQSGFYTTFFWGTDGGDFWWDNGTPNTFYGFHPFPIDGVHKWEMATDYGADFTNYNDNIAWNTWYLQAARVWSDGNGKHTEYYYNLPNTSSAYMVSHTASTSYGNTNPPSPALTWGDAPWDATPDTGGFPAGQTNEVYDGIIRGIQIYNNLLSVSDIIAEAASPLSTVDGADFIWYLNVNPTPTDISDKSGRGHDPEWVGSVRPDLWKE